MRQSGQESPAACHLTRRRGAGGSNCKGGESPGLHKRRLCEVRKVGETLAGARGSGPLAQCFQFSPTVGFATVKADWGRVEAAEGCSVAVARYEVIAAQITHGLLRGAEQTNWFALPLVGDKSRYWWVWEAGLPGEGVRAHEIAFRGRLSPPSLASQGGQSKFVKMKEWRHTLPHG